MTTLQQPQSDTRDQAKRDAWRMSVSGIALVTGLELRQRIRSTRWKVALGVVGAMIGAVARLTIAASNAMNFQTGDVVFGLIVFFVLFLALLVSPTLSSTTINGDAREGTLAPLQSTRLSAVDIVLGKLLASWIASLAFLAVAVPFILLGFANADAEIGAMFSVIPVLAIELLVVCAWGLGWSALTSRTAASAVLTYMTVAVVTAVLPIVFALLSAIWTTPTTTTSYFREYTDSATAGAIKDENGQYYTCHQDTYTSNEARTDRLWWLLAVNPYVIVADSAPTPAPRANNYFSTNGLLDSMKQGVRELRLGTVNGAEVNDCGALTPGQQARINARNNLSPVWPWGLAAQVLFALGALWIAVRRVTVPYAKLSRGTRVA